jgi:M6 family metalloprotease-like protein
MRRPAFLVALTLIVLTVDLAGIAVAGSSPTRWLKPLTNAQSTGGSNTPVHVSRAVTKGAQRVVAILAEFPDRAHVADTDTIRRNFDELSSFYKEASYGLAWIEWTITDRWYQVQTPLSKLDIEQWNYKQTDMDKFEREAVWAADGRVDFRNYDYVYIIAAGGVWGHAKCDFGVRTNDGLNTFKGVVLNEEDEVGTYIHELGHLLPSDYKAFEGCGLPDLYSYYGARQDETANIWVGPWDLMASSLNPGFGAWSKITLGWIQPDEIRLDKNKSTAVDLLPLEEDSGTRAVVVPIDKERSYIIEVRRQIGSDNALPAEGVLITFVDLTRDSGDGPVRVVDSKPATETLKDAPFTKGDIFQDDKNQFYVLIALAHGTGFTIVVLGSKEQLLKDADQDGLVDAVERELGTDPKNPDSDGDGLNDGDEVNRYGTNPLNADTDNDGLPDGKEVQLGTDPLSPDSDGDGLTDGREIQLGTNPLAADSDADGLKDGDEVDRYGTNPLMPDTDQDGLTDAREMSLGTNPSNPDTDGDFWRDGLDPARTNALMPNILVVAVCVLALVSAIAYRRHRKSAVGTASSKQHPALITEQRSEQVSGKFCMSCGSALTAGSDFCYTCGAKQRKA